MPNFGPPRIVSGFQPVTFVSGVYADFFQPQQQVVVLDASRRGVPIPIQGQDRVVPPNTFVQDDD